MTHATSAWYWVTIAVLAPVLLLSAMVLGVYYLSVQVWVHRPRAT